MTVTDSSAGQTPFPLLTPSPAPSFFVRKCSVDKLDSLGCLVLFPLPFTCGLLAALSLLAGKARTPLFRRAEDSLLGFLALELVPTISISLDDPVDSSDAEGRVAGRFP
jgi:hypothetical protein